MEKECNSIILRELLIAMDKMFSDSKMNNTIKLNLMYGIFLENNKFIICKEDKSDYCDCLCLYEYFTHERVGHGIIINSNLICNWRKGGKIYLDGNNQLQMGFCVPLTELLSKFSKKRVTTEKEISYLYSNVNKYIRENPEFIIQLFNSKKEKTR